MRVRLKIQKENRWMGYPVPKGFVGSNPTPRTNQPFLEERFEGVRKFDRDLIDLLRRGGTLSEEDILASLNISPSDTDLVKAVAKQLEILEEYGLVEFTGRGWRWRG